MFRDVWWKLRFAYLPFALLTLVVPPLYALGWWLLTQVGLDLDRDMVGFWLPGLLAFVLVEFFVDKNINKLKFSTKRNLAIFYFTVAGFALAIPIGLAHWALESKFAKITRVATAADISPDDRTSYYIVHKICMERDAERHYSTVRRNVKNDAPEDFEIYVAAPACNQRSPTVWIGLLYSAEIKDRLSVSAMEHDYRAFAAKTETVFAKDDVSKYPYFEKLGASRERRNFLRAIQSNSGLPASPVILVPRREDYVRTTDFAIRAYLWSLGIGLPLWLGMILLPALDHEKLKPRDKRDEQLQSLLISRFFRPRRNHYGAAILIDTNIAVFAIMALSGLGFTSFEAEDLISWGATYGPLDHGWGLFRLVSSLFVHDGLAHLMGNMYGLLFACIYLASVGTPIAKNGRLIFTYLFCGIAGNLASLAMHPKMVAVGASGAILGLWGVLMVLALLRDARLEGNEKAVLVNVGIFAGLTILLGFLPGIDNVAHVGGFASGCGLGFAYYLIDRNRRPAKPPRHSHKVPTENDAGYGSAD